MKRIAMLALAVLAATGCEDQKQFLVSVGQSEAEAMAAIRRAWPKASFQGFDGTIGAQAVPVKYSLATVRADSMTGVLMIFRDGCISRLGLTWEAPDGITLRAGLLYPARPGGPGPVLRRGDSRDSPVTGALCLNGRGVDHSCLRGLVRLPEGATIVGGGRECPRCRHEDEQIMLVELLIDVNYEATDLRDTVVLLGWRREDGYPTQVERVVLLRTDLTELDSRGLTRWPPATKPPLPEKGRPGPLLSPLPLSRPARPATRPRLIIHKGDENIRYPPPELPEGMMGL